MKIEKRYVVQIGQPDDVTVVVAGCGGTGSFLALHLARLAYHARDRHGIELGLVFVDPDVVEEKNVGRQNFCPAEVGQAKAWALMRRYNAAFGLDIEARVEKIGARAENGVGFHLVVGCVDNGAARRDIRDLVSGRGHRWWWLDCGNHEQAGQVVLGNRELDEPEISMMGFCTGLPLPSVVHPELLEDAASGKRQAASGLSCAELALMDSQSLMVNQAVAGWAAQYVYRLVLARDLDVSATYLDLAAGSARSMPILSGDDGAD